MKVLLCGGGNAIHVLSAYISAKDYTNVTILSLFPGEADRLRDAIPDEGIRCVNDLGEDIIGKPNAVIDKAEDVPKDIDIVIFALPSFTHEMYLKALKPFLKQGVTIGAVSCCVCLLYLLKFDSHIFIILLYHRCPVRVDLIYVLYIT